MLAFILYGWDTSIHDISRSKFLWFYLVNLVANLWFYLLNLKVNWFFHQVNLFKQLILNSNSNQLELGSTQSHLVFYINTYHNSLTWNAFLSRATSSSDEQSTTALFPGSYSLSVIITSFNDVKIYNLQIYEYISSK